VCFEWQKSSLGVLIARVEVALPDPATCHSRAASLESNRGRFLCKVVLPTFTSCTSATSEALKNARELPTSFLPSSITDGSYNHIQFGLFVRVDVGLKHQVWQDAPSLG